jgi:hypothetical protein
MATETKSAQVETLVTMIASGATVQNAARRAGISRTTAWRRLNDPEVVQRIGRARDEVLAQTVNRSAANAFEAFDVLRELLHDQRASIRLGAAKVLVEVALKYRVTLDTEARLAALEERYG